MSEMLTMPEAAAHAKVTRGVVYKWMKRGLPSVKIGKTRRILATDLEEFIQRHRVTPEAATVV